MIKRVNLRAYPRTLAGVAVTRAQLLATQDYIMAHLPPRWEQRPLPDVFAEIFMLGVASTAHLNAGRQALSEAERHD